MSENETIEIRDVGPVAHLSIPLPRGGGIVVLRGDNGVGKSHSLAAVQTLFGNGPRVPSRDGSLGAQVEGLGARLTIGGRSNRSGEVEVSHLEGEDPSLLVDPSIKSAVAADAMRIKALLRLARAQVDVSKFAELVDGQERLAALCRPESIDPRNDVPSMAASIKRDLELAARAAEAASENAFAKADGVRATLETIEGEDVTFRHADAKAANDALTKAIREHQDVQTRSTQCAQAIEAAEEARASLEAYGDSGTETAVENARKEHERRVAVVETLKQQLRTAQAEVVDAEGKLAAEETAAKRRAPLERAVEAAKGVTRIAPEEVATLEAAVAVEQEEVAAWGLRDRTQRLHDQVKENEEEGRRQSETGVALREAAKGTERVLIEAVSAVCPKNMEIHEGRLVVLTDRGREYFCELSHGERWRMALDISVAAVGTDGVLIVRQEAYESLAPHNRKEVAEHCVALGVTILTAEAADGAIRAELEETAS